MHLALSFCLPLSLLPPAPESISAGSISWHEYSLPAESLVGESRRLRLRRRQRRRGEGPRAEAGAQKTRRKERIEAERKPHHGRWGGVRNSGASDRTAKRRIFILFYDARTNRRRFKQKMHRNLALKKEETGGSACVKWVCARRQLHQLCKRIGAGLQGWPTWRMCITHGG